MQTITLTEEGKLARLAFNKSTKPLGERSDDDIRDLAIAAIKSKSKSLAMLFELPLPDLEDLLTDQADQKIAALDTKTMTTGDISNLQNGARNRRRDRTANKTNEHNKPAANSDVEE